MEGAVVEDMEGAITVLEGVAEKGEPVKSELPPRMLRLRLPPYIFALDIFG
jgi:hypothetical protein